MKKKLIQLLQKSAQQLLDRSIDFTFPRLCIICDVPCEGQRKWICISCEQKFLRNNQERDYCPHCAQNRRYRTCSCEYARDFPFNRLYSILDYDESLQKLIHCFKYRGFNKLAFDLGVILGSCVPLDFLAGADFAVAVPLHPFRHFQRGYNQAEWLGRGFMSSNDTVPFISGIVTRSRYTRTQTKLVRSERQRNLESAFTISGKSREQVKGRTILLVDDVVTTGSTISACSRALLSAGCSEVRVLSLARD